VKNLNKPEEAARHAAMLFFHALTCVHAIVTIIKVSSGSVSLLLLLTVSLTIRNFFCIHARL